MYEVSDGARTNDEVNIIECLVFIKATAETQRGWGQSRWGAGGEAEEMEEGGGKNESAF